MIDDRNKIRQEAHLPLVDTEKEKRNTNQVLRSIEKNIAQKTIKDDLREIVIQELQKENFPLAFNTNTDLVIDNRIKQKLGNLNIDD